MNLIKLYPWQKSLLMIARAILYPKSQIITVSPDEESAKKTYDTTVKLLTYDPCVNSLYNNRNNLIINFKNGSTIECISPKPDKPESENIRGKRANIKPWMYDWEYMISDDVIDKVLEPYIKKGDKY